MPPSDETEQASPNPELELPPHYFELYSLAVEMADRISSRRVIANSFFATVNTAIIALIGGQNLPWYVAVAGLVLALAWWLLLKSYRDLNSAKFKVINNMEARFSTKIFTEEWSHLKKDTRPIPFTIRPRQMRPWLTQYRELGQVERWIPGMFAIIYAINLLSRLS